VGIVHLARYARKRDWLDQELAEFFRVRDALIQAGLNVDTEHGVTDEGDPWFVFIRPQTEEVTAHFARIDGHLVADSSASPVPLYGRDLRSLLSQVFRQQMALIPSRESNGGGGGNVTLHPASMLVAFVATAFLQVQQGTREGTPGEGDGHGEGIRGFGGVRGEDSGKSISGRLATSPASSTLPANPAGRAVTFSDSGVVADHGIAGGIMTTVLFAALGALHDLEATAAERGDGDPEPASQGSAAAALPLAVASAAPQSGETGFGTHGDAGPGARPDRASSPVDATETDGPPGEAPPAVATPTPETSVTPLPLTARAAPASPSAELEAEGLFMPALMAAPAPDGEAEGESDSAGASNGDSNGFLLTDLESREIVTLGQSDLFEDSIQIIFRDVLDDAIGPDGDAPPSIDTLMSAVNQGVPESLSSIVSFINSGREDPATVIYDPQTLFGQASDAFTDSAGGRPTFVLFESDAIKATAFAFMPGLVFLDSRALDEVAVSLGAPSEEVDLAGEDDITLLGLVDIADGTGDDGFGG